MVVSAVRDHEAPDWLLDQVEDEFAACWQWTGPRLKRYGGQGGDRAVVKRDGATTTTVGRALWSDVVGPVPDDVVVRHTCDNAMCVRPSHLVLGTAADNTADARSRGRLRPGGRVA